MLRAAPHRQVGIAEPRGVAADDGQEELAQVLLVACAEPAELPIFNLLSDHR
jgi:hypothetical protein